MTHFCSCLYKLPNRYSYSILCKFLYMNLSRCCHSACNIQSYNL